MATLDTSNEPQPNSPATPVAPSLKEMAAFQQYLLEQQNPRLGLGLAFAGMLLGTMLWAAVTFFTKFQIGYMAVAIGFLVGYCISHFGKNLSKIYAGMGAVLGLIGCLLGNLFSACAFIGDAQNMGFFEVLSRLDLSSITTILQKTFQPMDLLFYALATYTGYKYAFRRVGQEQFDEFRSKFAPVPPPQT